MAYDLNMVRTFVLLYETRSVTRTAERLYVSQPSVSYTLGKLRRTFTNPLFVRSAAGMVPTALADEIYPKLRESLAFIDEAMLGADAFEPASSRHTFRLLMTDLGEIALLPRVLARVRAAAPGVSLDVLPFDAETARQSLVVGAADAAICTPRLEGPDLTRDVLSRQDYVGICDGAHPRIGGRPSLAAYLAERHVVIDAAIGHDHVEDAIRSLGHEKDVAIRLSRFSVLPDILAGTEYLSTVPREIGEIFARTRGVRSFELPFPHATGEIGLYTYARSLPSPSASWLRATIRAALQDPALRDPAPQDPAGPATRRRPARTPSGSPSPAGSARTRGPAAPRSAAGRES